MRITSPTSAGFATCGAPSRRRRFGETAFAMDQARKLERETGFEPATSTLARSHSTTELFPLVVNVLLYQMGDISGNSGLNSRRRGHLTPQAPSLLYPELTLIDDQGIA